MILSLHFIPITFSGVVTIPSPLIFFLFTHVLSLVRFPHSHPHAPLRMRRPIASLHLHHVLMSRVYLAFLALYMYVSCR